MEQHDNGNIRWEKLEEELEHPGSTEPDSDLSEEEWKVLLFFKRLRAGVKPVDVEKSFPTGEGWSRLGARISQSELSVTDDTRNHKIAYLYRFRYTVAALVLLVAGSALWLMLPSGSRAKKSTQAVASAERQRADLPASEEVQLILADGRKVNVDQHNSIIEANGVNITTADGTIQYQEDANVSSKAAKAIAYNSVIVPRGKKSHVVLPDGSKVWVNAASKITFPASFPEDSREIAVEGEAYFSVKADEKRPFVVHTNDVDVKVLGTVFNVNTYERLLRTTLISGKVRVSNSRSADQILTPGEQAVSDNVSGSMKTNKVNVKAFTAWKDGDIYMEDASLEDIVVSLERSFDYEIVFADNELKNIRFTLDLLGPQNLQEVLEHIALLDTRIRFEVLGRKAIISKTR